MSKRFAGNPRTLNPDGIIHNGEVGVVESPGPSQAYIPSNAISGNQFRLLNTSNHDVTLGVESNAFEIELVDADPQASIIIPPGSMFYGVTGWSTVHDTFQLFATVTSAVSGGTGPVGDWLPKLNPKFTGTLTGPIIEMGEQSATWGAEPTEEGYFLVDPAAAGLVLETDGDANLYSRYGRWQTQGDLFVTAEGGPLTLRSFNGHAQLLGGQRVGVSSGSNRLSFSPTEMTIYGNLLKMGYYNYSTAQFERYIQADATGVTAVGDINTRLVVAPRRIDVIGGDSVNIVGGDLGNAPNIQLGNDTISITADATNPGNSITLDSQGITVGDYPKVTRVLPLDSLADNQLVTKGQLAGSGLDGDYLPKENPTFTGAMTGEEYVSNDGFVFRDDDELSVKINSGAFSVDGTDSVTFNVPGGISGDANSVNFYAADYISLQAEGPEEGIELLARNGSLDAYTKTTYLQSTVRTEIDSDMIEVTAATKLTLSGGFENVIELRADEVTVSKYPTITTPKPLAELTANQLITKAQLTEAGVGGDFLPKDDPTYTGTLTGGNADVLLLGVRGNIAVGEDEVSARVMIAPSGISFDGHMGESRVDLSSTDFTGGGMNSIALQSKNVLVEGTNFTLRAVAGEDGYGDLDLRAARNITFGAINGNVVAATRSFAIAPTPTEDLIASFDNANIVMGDPSTSPQDNPKFHVWGESEFATNPVLLGTLASGELPGMALITKDQVFDVLNGVAASLNLKTQPKIVNLEPYSDVDNDQLVTKVQVADMIAAALAAHGIT